jgi:DNA-binding MarR family transcriptional regulator
MTSDEYARALVSIAARATSFRLLVAAELRAISRADAAEANLSSAESADLILKTLCRKGLFQKRGRRNIVYELTDTGRAALAAIRSLRSTAAPCPQGGWWLTVKRGPSGSYSDLQAAIEESCPLFAYRCTGDFNYLVMLNEEQAGPALLDDLQARLRRAGGIEVAAARLHLSD